MCTRKFVHTVHIGRFARIYFIMAFLKHVLSGLVALPWNLSHAGLETLLFSLLERFRVASVRSGRMPWILDMPDSYFGTLF